VVVYPAEEVLFPKVRQFPPVEPEQLLIDADPIATPSLALTVANGLAACELIIKCTLIIVIMILQYLAN
jgi:hypothetical protein